MREASLPVEVLKSRGFSAFAKALTETGIDKVIDHEGHFTVFAPTNEAFENPKSYPLHFSLRDRVAYHIARGLIKESTIQNDQLVPTLLAKRTIRFNIYNIKGSEVVTLNGQRVKFANYAAHNGLVHELQNGLDFIPPLNGTHGTILKDLPQYSLFLNIFEKYYPGLLDHPKNFELTLLVPGNQVIQNQNALDNGVTEDILAQKLLMNHVIPTTWYSIALTTQKLPITLGGKALDKLNLTLTDFTAKNGVFHEVDTLL